MTTASATADTNAARSAAASGSPSTHASRASWQGRAFGGIVLAAFLLYGIGSATADQPIGLALVVLNSIAVAFAGVIGFQLLRSSERSIGLGYLVARLAEAGLLAGGIFMAELADVGDADTTGYLLAMIALGIGSIPFLRALRRQRSIPRPLATWGIFGYAALAAGTLLELSTGRSIAVVYAAPGGLFELTLGLYLLRYGFHREATPGPAREGRHAVNTWELERRMSFMGVAERQRRDA